MQLRQAIFTLSIVTTSIIMPAAANELRNAANNMCNHIKSCVQGQMGDISSLPPQMQQMVKSQIDNMCKNMLDIENVSEAMVHKQAAIACLNSISALSCDQIENSGETPACKQLEKSLQQ